MVYEKRNFDLETVLTIITGIFLIEDFDEIYELYQYVFMDPLINTMSIQILHESMINHLLEIHPELNGIEYTPSIDGDIDKWLAMQKAKLGSKIPVCVIGHTLTTRGKEKIKTIRYYE